jgi:hypothetical protein
MKNHSEKCDGISGCSSVKFFRNQNHLSSSGYNVDPKTLQSILGHSNISTTLGYYTMVNDKQRRKALELYGDAIRNGDRKDDDNPEDRVDSANSKMKIKQITGSEDVGFIVVKKRPC